MKSYLFQNDLVLHGPFRRHKWASHSCQCRCPYQNWREKWCLVRFTDELVNIKAERCFSNVTWKEHGTTRSWTFVFYFSLSSHPSFLLSPSYPLMSGKYFFFFLKGFSTVTGVNQLWKLLEWIFLFFHYWFSILVKLLILIIGRKCAMACQNTDLYSLFLPELSIFSFWTHIQ